MNAKKFNNALCFALITQLCATPVLACDLCGIFDTVRTYEVEKDTLRLGIAEQFTYFDTVQEDGHYVENRGDEHLSSSITQFMGSYDFTDTMSLQLTLPLIHREYRQVESGPGSLTGIGDMSLLLRAVAYHYSDADSTVGVQLFGGVKLPTGDADRLGQGHEHQEDDAAHEHEVDSDMDIHDEVAGEGHEGVSMAEEDHHDEHQHTHAAFARHGGEHHDEEMITSALHGHDLALGSGSVDFPLGVGVFIRHGMAVLAGEASYTFRTDGDEQYRYADDFLWNVGPGVLVPLEEHLTMLAKLRFSGEYKKKDHSQDQLDESTAVRSIFWGPEISITRGTWSLDLASDFPVDINNSGTQLVPDYRLRAAMIVRF